MAAAIFSSACHHGEQIPIGSSQRPFHELFAPVDTIRLDPSILVADITFLDVSPSGDLLVSDYSMGRVDLYSSSGDHLLTLQTESCSPGEPIRPLYSRFVGRSQVLVATGSVAYLFDLEGNCIGRVDALTPPPQSVCASGDTVHTYTSVGGGRPLARSFTRSWEQISEIALPPPRYPRLTRVYRGLLGRQLACSESGAYFLYPEESDAREVSPHSRPSRYKPGFHVAPPRDQIGGDMATLIEDSRRLHRESTRAAAVFALDRRRRIVAFVNVPRQPEGGGTFSMGLNMVDDSARPGQESLSTILEKGPLAAGNGLLYVLGDLSLDADGVPGNPSIEVYRFVPPGDQAR